MWATWALVGQAPFTGDSMLPLGPHHTLCPSAFHWLLFASLGKECQWVFMGVSFPWVKSHCGGGWEEAYVFSSW